jgi:uncharacterized protein DUF3309
MLHPEASGGSTIFEIGEMSLWKEKANGAHAQVFRYAKARARALRPPRETPGLMHVSAVINKNAVWGKCGGMRKVSARGYPMLRTILLIIIVLALLGSLPLYPYSSGWGYYPSGGLGLILIILIIWAVMDRGV